MPATRAALRPSIASLAAIALLATTFITTTAWAGQQNKTVDIYWIDVEGGAATLIVTPAGESILIDTGNPGNRDAQRIVKVAGQEAKLRRIDHLVVTHYHRDHYGGAETLSKLMPIGTVYDNGVFEGMPDNPGKAYFSMACEKRVVVQPGTKIKLRQPKGAPPLTFRFLGARKQFIKLPSAPANSGPCAMHKPKDRDGSDNANSLVMMLEYGDFRFYDAGDLTWNQEHKLVCPKNLVGKVDVYQVTHHGLSSSNNPVVLQSIEPTVAIMNNGVTKGAAADVFSALRATKSIKAIYQVHKNERRDGDVNNVADSHIANLKRDCDGNHIKLTVAPDGKRYTVAVPARNHLATYPTRER